jgi:hypothetical protein
VGSFGELRGQSAKERSLAPGLSICIGRRLDSSTIIDDMRVYRRARSVKIPPGDAITLTPERRTITGDTSLPGSE